MASFDSERFFTDFGVEHWTSGKNVTPGWVNIRCPMCDDHSNHGGFSPQGKYNCWRCGGHDVVTVLSKLLGMDEGQAIRTVRRYTTNLHRPSRVKKERKADASRDVKLPFGCGALRPEHRRYLLQRNFSPKRLRNTFGIMGTGPVGDYKFRIIAPVYLDRKLVSYQGRDITGKAELRYKACKEENEAVHHKHTLYGIDLVPGRAGVVVEGITDVWRLGPGAVGTFGTSVTDEQLIMIYKRFDEIYLLFDPEDEMGMQRATEIVMNLQALGRTAMLIELDGVGDPAMLSDADAREMMIEYTGQYWGR